MNAPSKAHDPRRVFVVSHLIGVAIALALLAAMGQFSHGACARCFNKQAVVVAQPQIVQTVAPSIITAPSPVVYPIGAALRQDAEFRAGGLERELLELRQYKAVNEAYLAGQRSVLGPATGPGAAATSPAAAPDRAAVCSPGTAPGPAPAPVSEPPAAPPEAPAAAAPQSHPILAATCGKCHGGEHAKANLWLDDSTPWPTGDEGDAKRGKVAGVLWTGHTAEGTAMPPKGPVSDEIAATIMSELFGAAADSEAAQ